MKIFKDYQLIGSTLYKQTINESKHLLWQIGGVPCLDADLWDFYFTKEKRIAKIRIMTNKNRIFKIGAELFDTNKKEINLGFGRQYMVDKFFWTIIEPQQKLFL